jgi:hypothetical protein
MPTIEEVPSGHDDARCIRADLIRLLVAPDAAQERADHYLSFRRLDMFSSSNRVPNQ